MRTHISRSIGLIAVLALVLAACGTEGTGDTTTTSAVPSTTSVAPTTTTLAPTTTTTPPAPSAVVVYFLIDETDDQARGPFLVPVYRGSEVASSLDEIEARAMELLLAGPTAAEATSIPAISSAIPSGTRLLDVEVSQGVATVNLSGEYDDGGGTASMSARLAQVVYTLTALDGIDSVTFELDGVPVTTFSSEGLILAGPQGRDDYYDTLPSVFIDSPALGETVASPIQVRGLSNVFEAVSQIMLTDDDGLPLFESHVMATCGTGCWGTWEIEVPYVVDRDQVGALVAFVYSAMDGSRIDIREQSVRLIAE
jgi:germination protein M